MGFPEQTSWKKLDLSFQILELLPRFLYFGRNEEECVFSGFLELSHKIQLISFLQLKIRFFYHHLNILSVRIFKLSRVHFNLHGHVIGNSRLIHTDENSLI